MLSFEPLIILFTFQLRPSSQKKYHYFFFRYKLFFILNSYSEKLSKYYAPFRILSTFSHSDLFYIRTLVFYFILSFFATPTEWSFIEFSWVFSKYQTCSQVLISFCIKSPKNYWLFVCFVQYHIFSQLNRTQKTAIRYKHLKVCAII